MPLPDASVIAALLASIASIAAATGLFVKMAVDLVKVATPNAPGWTRPVTAYGLSVLILLAVQTLLHVGSFAEQVAIAALAGILSAGAAVLATSLHNNARAPQPLEMSPDPGAISLADDVVDALVKRVNFLEGKGAPRSVSASSVQHVRPHPWSAELEAAWAAGEVDPTLFPDDDPLAEWAADMGAPADESGGESADSATSGQAE